MSDAEYVQIDWIDIQLIQRILRIIIEDTIQQIEKNLDWDIPVEAIFELWRASKLKPPFSKLSSHTQLIQRILVPSQLFELEEVKVSWTEENIDLIIRLLEHLGLIHTVELNKNQFASSVKIFSLPFGLLIFKEIDKLKEMPNISQLDFENWVKAYHPKHSQYTLDAFTKKVDMSVRSSQSLSPFNISLSLLLLMYGAIRRDKALKIQIDPVKNITNYQEIISKQLSLVGKQILKRDPMSRGTLLDHIQASDKIKRVLENPGLFARDSVPSQEGGIEYKIYFDLGSEDISHSKTQLFLDSVLRAVIVNAGKKNIKAPVEIVSLFKSNINTINITMEPVYTKILFGEVPNTRYLMTLHSRAEYITNHLEEVEEQDDYFEG